jgi:O-methyltransferase involved in polyketide biosynthesis
VRADRPSTTARLIAAATVFLSRDPRYRDLVPAGAAELCARFVSVEAVSRAPLSWAVWLAERATVPGLMLHFMLRKRFIEDSVRASLAAGGRQVVVIGAGFDTLGARLAAEFPQARFIEIDHPATQAAKRLAIDERGNLDFIAADLAEVRLQDALAGGAYRRGRLHRDGARLRRPLEVPQRDAARHPAAVAVERAVQVGDAARDAAAA